MEMLKKKWRAATIRAVIPAISTGPPLRNPTLTNCTVPLKIIIPEARAHRGPKPCFSSSSPYPIPRTTNVTIIGSEVVKAADKVLLSIPFLIQSLL